MNSEIPEFVDGVDPEIQEARKNSLKERIKSENWKIRKDIYDEISSNIDKFNNKENIDILSLVEFVYLYILLPSLKQLFYVRFHLNNLLVHYNLRWSAWMY
jgi:hypothetical protein